MVSEARRSDFTPDRIEAQQRRENVIDGRRLNFRMAASEIPGDDLIHSLQGQYLTALFYGFLTYYAFPDTWLEQTIPSLLVSVATGTAMAVGNESFHMHAGSMLTSLRAD